MWISERGRRLPVQESEAEVGVVTLGGDPMRREPGRRTALAARLFPRRLHLAACGGGPGAGAEGRAERESPCILGRVQEKAELAPGEVCLSGGTGEIRLGAEGLELLGAVKVNGVALEGYIRQIVNEMLDGMGG